MFVLVWASHNNIFRELVKVYNNVPRKLNIIEEKIQQYSNWQVPFQGRPVELQPHLLILFILLYMSHKMFSHLQTNKKMKLCTFNLPTYITCFLDKDFEMQVVAHSHLFNFFFVFDFSWWRR